MDLFLFPPFFFLDSKTVALHDSKFKIADLMLDLDAPLNQPTVCFSPPSSDWLFLPDIRLKQLSFTKFFRLITLLPELSDIFNMSILQCNSKYMSENK